MPAYIVVLAPAFAVLVVAVFCLIIVLGYVLFLRPVLDWIGTRGPGFIGGIIRWVTRPLTRRIDRFAAHHMAALTRAYLAGVAPGVVLLNQTTELVQRVAGTLGDMSEQTWRALWTLRHETVPRLIAAALVPIRAQLARHTDRLDTLELLNRRVAVVIGTGLRALPWGAPGDYVGNFDAWWDSYRHLWRQTFEHLVPRLNRVQFELLPRIAARVSELEVIVTRIREEALPAIRQRIGRIEDALGDLVADPSAWVLTMLGLGMLPVLAPDAMRAALRRLTCRNTQDVADRLCRTDEAWLESLLAGTLLWATVVDPRVLARAAETVTDGLHDVIRATALR